MTEEQELILDMFEQACLCGGAEDKYYDHSCLSAYEHAQAYLVKHEIIKNEDCIRPLIHLPGKTNGKRN